MDIGSALTRAQLPATPRASPQDDDVAPDNGFDVTPKQTLWRKSPDDPMQWMAGSCATEIGAWRERDPTVASLRIPEGVNVITDDAGRGRPVTAGAEFVSPGRRRRRTPLPAPTT